MRDSFKTIATETRNEIKIERSRFLATVCPVDSKVGANERYLLLKKEFHDATHNCYAYVTGVEPHQESRYSDDGEPSGTAGKPIHDAILSHDLTNVLVVVTRYFGGIKLGTGGLSRAYREAANQVLNQASVVERFLNQKFSLRFDHDQISVVMKTLSDYRLKPIEKLYARQVVIKGEIRLRLWERFCTAMTDRSHGKVAIDKEL